MYFLLTCGLLLPFFGTTLGAAFIFFMKSSLHPLAEQVMLGFAAGVMTAASIWSLLLPSMEQASNLGVFSFVPAAAGFLGGVAFLAATDALVRYLEEKGKPCPGGGQGQRSMMTLAVIIHNIPEGLAVGVAFGAAAGGDPLGAASGAGMAGAITLMFGIGLQNLPEGMAVSVPLLREGFSRRKAFFCGQLSGIVEPVAAVLGAVVAASAESALPYALAFAAGAMIFVVVEEVVPEAQASGHGDAATLGVMVGFVVMMCLDVGFG